MKTRFCYFLVAAAVILAGCSRVGEAPNASYLPASSPAAKPAGGTIDVTLRLRYVSPGTKGLTVRTFGPDSFEQAFALTTKSPGCVQQAGARVCPVALKLNAAGKYTVTIFVYDEAPIKGAIPPAAKELSGALSVPIVVRTGTGNAFSITLVGLPVAVKMDVPNAKAGTPFGQPQRLGVTAFDQSGNAIVGPYSTPLTLFDSDKSGATKIATSGADNPPPGKLLSSSDTATLAYTGLAIVPAKIGVVADGEGTFAPALNPIVYKGPNPISLTGYASVPITVTEAGWTDSPYNKSITASTDGFCTKLATIKQNSSTSFTVTRDPFPRTGGCTLKLSDGAGQTFSTGISLRSSGRLFAAGSSGGKGFVDRIEPGLYITALGSGFHEPVAVASDSSTNVYVADIAASSIAKIDPNGGITAVGSGFSEAEGVAVDTNDNVFVSDGINNTVWKIDSNGTQTSFATVNFPGALAVDNLGNVYVTLTVNGDVDKITPQGSISTIASGLNDPQGVAVDSSGNVYVSNSGHGTVEMIAPGGATTPIGTQSTFSHPWGIAVDNVGNVYVADPGSEAIKIVSPPFTSANNYGSVATFSAVGTEGISLDFPRDPFPFIRQRTAPARKR